MKVREWVLEQSNFILFSSFLHQIKESYSILYSIFVFKTISFYFHFCFDSYIISIYPKYPMYIYPTFMYIYSLARIYIWTRSPSIIKKIHKTKHITFCVCVHKCFRLYLLLKGCRMSQKPFSALISNNSLLCKIWDTLCIFLI